MVSYEESMGFHLGRTFQKLVNRLAQEFKNYNITPEQYGLLNILIDSDGISQKELAYQAGKNQTTITRALDILNKKNFIIRQSTTDDRRVSLIKITNEGVELMNQLVPIAQNLFNDIFKDFPQNEINDLKVLLDKLFDAI